MSSCTTRSLVGHENTQRWIYHLFCIIILILCVCTIPTYRVCRPYGTHFQVFGVTVISVGGLNPCYNYRIYTFKQPFKYYIWHCCVAQYWHRKVSLASLACPPFTVQFWSNKHCRRMVKWLHVLQKCKGTSNKAYTVRDFVHLSWLLSCTCSESALTQTSGES